MGRIDNNDFEYLCELSMLEFSSQNKQVFLTQLNDIISMMDRFSDISIDVEPVFKDDLMLLRDDVVLPSLPREDFLSVVPKSKDGYVLL